MCTDTILTAILERRTIRRFIDEPVSRHALDHLCDAARWAPSGLNNQPWRFVTVQTPEMLATLAECTKYGKILREAGGAVAVFLDTEHLYHREKDIQGVGAALQNLLLAAHGMGLGACWLGEILNRRDEVEKALGVDKALELMAVVAVGFPLDDDPAPKKERLPLDQLIVGRF